MSRGLLARFAPRGAPSFPMLSLSFLLRHLRQSGSSCPDYPAWWDGYSRACWNFPAELQTNRTGTPWRRQLLSNHLFNLPDSSLPCCSTITGLSLLLLLLLLLVLVLVPHFLSCSTLPFLLLWTRVLFLSLHLSASPCSWPVPQQCSFFCLRCFGDMMCLGHPCFLPLLGASTLWSNSTKVAGFEHGTAKMEQATGHQPHSVCQVLDIPCVMLMSSAYSTAIKRRR